MPPISGWVWLAVGILLVVVLLMLIFGCQPIDLNTGGKK
jgi:hypothetical protein